MAMFDEAASADGSEPQLQLAIWPMAPPLSPDRKRMRLDEECINTWEPSYIGEMFEEDKPDLIGDSPEILLKRDTAKSSTDRAIARLDAELAAKGYHPSEAIAGGLRVLALVVAMSVKFDAANDRLMAQIIYVCVGANLRAHPEGVHEYENGAWRPTEVLPDWVSDRIEVFLSVCCRVCCKLSEHDIDRSFEAVIGFIAGQPQAELDVPTTSRSFTGQNSWASTAGIAIERCSSRFTSMEKAEVVLNAFVYYFKEEQCPATSMINFVDCTLRLDAHGNIFRIPKSPTNNVYFHVDMELKFRAPDSEIMRFRRAFTCTFAGNEQGRHADSCSDALSWHGCLYPHVILVYSGSGGDGKSLRTILRANVMGSSHGFLSSSCFTIPEEFRKQGGQVAHKKAVTLQECSGGTLLLEPEVKGWSAGDRKPCRPNYGKRTEYYRWDRTAKYWEMNLIVPAIHGNPAEVDLLESWWRRFLVVDFASKYVADVPSVDIDNKVFLSDPSLREFFESGLAKFIFVHEFLFPFMKRYNQAHCYSYLDKPPPELLERAKQFTQKMANGGFNAYITPVARDEAVEGLYEMAMQISADERLLRDLHAEMDERHVYLKTHVINKHKSIPGTCLASTKGKETKIDHVHRAIATNPWIFKWEPREKGFRKLGMNMEKFEDAIGPNSGGVFGTSEEWGNIWSFMNRGMTDGEVNDDLEDAFAVAGNQDAVTVREHTHKPTSTPQELGVSTSLKTTSIASNLRPHRLNISETGG